MKNILIITLLITMSYGFKTVAQENLSAKQIIEKADEKILGKTNTSIMEMVIVRPTWKRAITMKSWGRGNKFSMTYITAPAKDKGQVFMKRKTEMWNWMPTISRMIKIPASMMSQGWMGSDYTNDDILKESSIVVDYTHKIVSEEEINKQLTYKIEMIPKENAAVIWSKVYKWITKNEFIQIKSEYYNEDDELVKSDHSYDFKIMDNRLIPTRIEIIPAGEDGKKTILYIKEMKFNVELPETFFSQQQMKRIR
jgi:hypothetical protein